MRPIATNIADFETLRKAGLVSVDKTARLHRLITTPGSTFFFYAFGLSFDSKTRQFVEGKVEKMQ